MTDKDFQGNITIREGALRPELETTEIKCGVAADVMFQSLAECRGKLYALAVNLPLVSDASSDTLETVAEVDEILLNLKARLSAEKPTTTALERYGQS